MAGNVSAPACEHEPAARSSSTRRPMSVLDAIFDLNPT
jgi:hypothetical protein